LYAGVGEKGFAGRESFVDNWQKNEKEIMKKREKEGTRIRF